jgi:hypothetical protein
MQLPSPPAAPGAGMDYNMREISKEKEGFIA